MEAKHTRWGWGPMRGAYAPQGGHVNIFGVQYGWIAQWDKERKWSPSWSLNFWSLLYFHHEPCRGLRWAFCRICLSAAFKRASYTKMNR